MYVNREIELGANGCAFDKRVMTLGRRIDERRRSIGISQAELARRVGMRQSTINSLINGDSRSSRKIVQLARELATTPAYLTGETEDPDAGASPPAPEPQVVHVMLPVALPAKPALAAMYEGLLLSLGDWSLMPVAELAQELATLLPSGLGVIRGPLRYAVSDADDGAPEPLEDVANVGREPRRARRR